MIEKIICWFAGHVRGKRTGVQIGKKTQFECPRCKAQWERKVKA